MPPIKLKLSLSKASLNSESTNGHADPPVSPSVSKVEGETAAGGGRKGKRKERDGEVGLAHGVDKGKGKANAGEAKSTMPVIRLKTSAATASVPTFEDDTADTAYGEPGPSSRTRRSPSLTSAPGIPDELDNVTPIPGNNIPLSTAPVSCTPRIYPTPVRKKPGPKLGSKNKPRQNVTPKTTKPMPKGRQSTLKREVSALPPHVRSRPSTPSASTSASPGTMPPPPLPSSSMIPGSMSPRSARDTPDIQVKAEVEEYNHEDVEMDETREESADPISAPFTPAEVSEQNAAGKVGTKWARSRKPLKELAQKIMIELRRKDEYALFSEPVNPDDFPGYLEAIGGEEQMMDLSTMQNKVDGNEYRSMDELEADLRLIVDAAQAFNPAGTIPHRSAKTMLTHGLRHIERTRPLVITPSSSPRPTESDAGTPWRGQSTFDAIDTPVELELPPESRIPTEMLAYPPNSLEALAVGWSLNGGRRVYIKRELRTREKFSGKWRHWDLDGTRSIEEIEDIDKVIPPRKRPRVVTDWRGMRQEAWWDWPGYGGANGQPPIPFTPYPRPPVLLEQELGVMDWGLFPEVSAQLAGQASARNTTEYDIMESMKSSTTASDVQEGFDSGVWFKDMLFGDQRGDAYTRSIDLFTGGPDMREVRAYAQTKYHAGVYRGDATKITSSVVASLRTLATPDSKPELGVSSKVLSGETDQKRIRKIAEDAYIRAVLRRLPKQLDIRPFILHQAEFSQCGDQKASNRALWWIGQDLERLVKKRDASPDVQVDLGQTGLAPAPTSSRARVGSSPLSSAPSSPRPTSTAVPPRIDYWGDDQPLEVAVRGVQPEELRKLRLEILAACKHYPLAQLRKFTHAEAEKKLPANVRNLLVEEQAAPPAGRA